MHDQRASPAREISQITLLLFHNDRGADPDHSNFQLFTLSGTIFACLSMTRPRRVEVEEKMKNSMENTKVSTNKFNKYHYAIVHLIIHHTPPMVAGCGFQFIRNLQYSYKREWKVWASQALSSKSTNNELIFFFTLAQQWAPASCAFCALNLAVLSSRWSSKFILVLII